MEKFHPAKVGWSNKINNWDLILISLSLLCLILLSDVDENNHFTGKRIIGTKSVTTLATCII